MSRIIISNSNNIYIDDYNSVILISNTKIIIKCKNNLLVIEGRELKVKDFSNIGMNISGIIQNISWQG